MKTIIYVICLTLAMLLGYGLHSLNDLHKKNIEKFSISTMDPAQFRQLLATDSGRVFMMPSIDLDSATQISKGNLVVIRGDGILDSLIVTESLLLIVGAD